MSYQRRLQKPAIAAHVSQSGKELRIASSLLSSPKEPFHGLQRAALIYLNMGIQVVCER